MIFREWYNCVLNKNKILIRIKINIVKSYHV